MAKKVLDGIEKQEQLARALQLNYFLIGFGLFYGILLSEHLLTYALVAGALAVITYSLQRISNRLELRNIEQTKILLWLMDILFFGSAFVATQTSGLLFYIFVLSAAILYGSERAALGYLFLAVGHEVWLKLTMDSRNFLLNAFSLIIFYLFFWFIAQYYKQKNQELLQAREDLIKIERSSTIQKMSMTLSHELNNPLTAVVINVDMLSKFLSKSTDIEKVRAMVGSLAKDVRRMKEIMDNLRNITGDKMSEVDYVSGRKIFSIKDSREQNPDQNEYNKP